jgi:hypothetical protein
LTCFISTTRFEFVAARGRKAFVTYLKSTWIGQQHNPDLYHQLFTQQIFSRCIEAEFQVADWLTASVILLIGALIVAILQHIQVFTPTKSLNTKLKFGSSMTNRTPRIFAQWILVQIPERNADDRIVDTLETDLSRLTIPELKRLEMPLYTKQAIRNEATITVRHLKASAKKQQRIDFLLRALYIDDGCTILNQNLIKELEQEVRAANGNHAAASSASTPSAASAAGATSRTNPSSSGKKRSRDSFSPSTNSTFSAMSAPLNRSHSNGLGYASATVQSSQPAGARAASGPSLGRSAPDDFMSFLNDHAELINRQLNGSSAARSSSASATTQAASTSSSHAAGGVSTTNHTQNGMNNGLYFHLPPPHMQQLWSSGPQPSFQDVMEQSVATSTSGPADAASATAAPNNHGYIINPSDPNQPHNEQEARLMHQLKQMGFDDRMSHHRTELLDGIRHSGKTTADEVMIFIIEQRESQLEARMEDQARLLSEGQKKEQQEKLAAQRHEKLVMAQTGKDLQKIFGRSWILNKMMVDGDNERMVDNIILRQRRDVFLKLLESEEKCNKWYGDLPKYYFFEVFKRLKTDHNDNLKWLQSEYEKLQAGLCDLSAQSKEGYPRIFLAARENCTEDVKPEVIVID